VNRDAHLVALASIHELFGARGIDYWLFGGWAVDFHAGHVSRPHDDLDLAVWSKDGDTIAGLLAASGWAHAPEEGEDGYTGYERGDVRLELAFLARDPNGVVYTPLEKGRGTWPEGSFSKDEAELGGVRARVISLDALQVDKSTLHDDPRVLAKDRADLATLARATQG
jgi:aminoglycoside-2''-adenylyltransferase